MNRELLEKQMGELPIVQYEFFETAELTFSPRVRSVCQLDCPRYGTSWACPPAVGTVEACRERCLAYPRALMLTTMSEVADIADLEGTLAARTDHEEITRAVRELFRAQGVEPYVLSTESCALCEECTYPDAPCRHPDRMFPCVESQGILVTELSERHGIGFWAEGNIVTWFSLLLFDEEAS